MRSGKWYKFIDDSQYYKMEYFDEHTIYVINVDGKKEVFGIRAWNKFIEVDSVIAERLNSLFS